MTSAQPDDRAPRQAFYGISEIAVAIAADRQLVTAWRRRGSHAMPEPDAELASGPIWLAATIEPWIARVRRSRGLEAQRDVPTEEAWRIARRALRCTALALEEPIRQPLLARALSELASALDDVGETTGPRADGVLFLRDSVAEALAAPFSRRRLSAVREALIDALPAVQQLVLLSNSR